MINILKELEKSVNKYPLKIAIKGISNDEYSYSEFFSLTKKISEYLNRLLGKNSGVFVIMSHSENLIFALFSLLISNNVYIPMSSKKEIALIHESLLELGCNCILTDNKNYDNLYKILGSSFTIINIDEIIQNIKENTINLNIKRIEQYKKYNDDICYILHTSGSTGKPKGVMVKKSNLNYITDNLQSIMPSNPKTKMLFTTPYIFDVSLTEMLSWVYDGGGVVCRSIEQHHWQEHLYSSIIKDHITHIAASPSVFSMLLSLLSEDKKRVISEQLVYVTLAGERFIPNIFKEWKNNQWKFRLFNAYGPTETTIYSTFFELSNIDEYKDIPIGIPLSGVDYLIDESTSELLIGGNGVTNGYTDKRLNTDKFILIENKIFYRTGDIVVEKNGNLYYNGRDDNQIQINGIRVELGEIEYKIEKIPDVIQAKVIYHDNKIKAFIKTFKSSKVYFQKFFNNNFETYMIPNVFYLLKDFPLNASNKIDKEKLLEYESISNGERQQETNLSESEEIIIKAFCETLDKNMDDFSLDTNFFAEGGDSLSATLLLIKLEEKFGLELNLSDIYTSSTVKSINKLIKKRKENSSTSLLSISEKEKYKFTENLTEKIYKYICDVEPTNEVHETIHLQRIYYFDDFDSHIEIEFDFGDLPQEIVITAIQNVFNTSYLFKSSIMDDKGDILFLVNKIKTIPIIEISQEPELYKEELSRVISNTISKNKKRRGLLSAFVLLKNKNKLFLYGKMDHSIADGSTLGTFRSLISYSLAGQKININKTYSDYCNLVKNVNNIDFLKKNKYFNELISINHNTRNVKHLSNNEKKNIIKIENHLNYYNSEDISIFIAYRIGSWLVDKLDSSSVVIKFLANGKNYLDEDYLHVIGDFHTSILLTFFKGEPYKTFFNRAKSIILENYSLIPFRPAYVYGHNYPYKNKEQEMIKRKLAHTNVVSIDFLGALYGKDKDKNIIKTFQFIEQLSKHDNTLYVTAYIIDNHLNILSNKQLDKL